MSLKPIRDEINGLRRALDNERNARKVQHEEIREVLENIMLMLDGKSRLVSERDAEGHLHFEFKKFKAVPLSEEEPNGS